MNIVINSFSNPKIKRLNGLMKNSQFRKKENIFVIEGAKEVNAALESGYKYEMFFICKEIFNDEALAKKIKLIEDVDNQFVYEVSKGVFMKVWLTGNPVRVLWLLFILSVMNLKI